jgi:FG-GAP-like repeat
MALATVLAACISVVIRVALALLVQHTAILAIAHGDGKHDLLWRDGTSGTVAIWLLNGLQVAQTGSLGGVPAAWVVAGTGDFNGDGKGDILWRNTSTGAVAIWLLKRASGRTDRNAWRGTKQLVDGRSR